MRVGWLLFALTAGVPTALGQICDWPPDDEAFVSAHALALDERRDDSPHPDLLGAPGEPLLPLSVATARDGAGPCRTIFGYLPYWESSANIQWDRLTHVACFSVEVNSNGTLGNQHGWPWTSVINAAHSHGVKVVLVATCFNDTSISTLINNATYKSTFFVNIRDRMLAGAADGLNIDFEGSGSWRSQIQGFMGELTAYLHGQIPGCEVTFAGPAVNWSSAWNLGALAASCDGIFIMGYAFAGSWSTTTGANAPLIGGSINITDTVLDEYYPVTQVLPQKLILGVPYYGHHWTTSSSAPRASVVSFVGSTRFRDDAVTVQTYGRLWDTVSQTPWYCWQSGSTWHQVWYDDAESLGGKWQLAQDRNLAGVGMWALNYDGTRPELWDELGARYVDACCADQPLAAEVVLFADDFDAGTSAANWQVRTSSSDYTADFAYDYSVRGIPPAPHSAGTTIGAKFTVNKNDGAGSVEALNAYPLGLLAGGDYALRCDAWINYCGGAGGGTGSTEFLLAGVNASGTRVNWPNNAASDGYLFAVDGEGGVANDYRAYRGPTEQAIGSGAYVARSQDSTDKLYPLLLPSPTYETAGAPGKHWVEVEVRQVGTATGTPLLEWRINGVKLASLGSLTATSGSVLIGTMDPYSSLANPPGDNFVVFDNVRVVQLAEADCNGTGVADGCEVIGGGDYDADGAVGMSDLAALAESAVGPDAAPAAANSTCAPVCLLAFDADSDGDIDLVDAAAFQLAFGQ